MNTDNQTIGFLKFDRVDEAQRSIEQRLKDHLEIYIRYTEQQSCEQASRCMNCGVPFCEAGCPIGSDISEWITLISKGRLKNAFEVLQDGIIFPEFTGRVCSAPCESACVLGINSPPVSIKSLEKYLIEYAFEQGWVQPKPPRHRTGKSIAVVGSGPTGLVSSHVLNKFGHTVHIFERQDRPGGLLRYGIPDHRLEKWVLDRRINILKAEGINFITNCNIGYNKSPWELVNNFDAIILCGGCTIPRDIPGPGRHGKGIFFVKEYLEAVNRLVAGDQVDFTPYSAKDKHVVAITGKAGGWLGVITRQNPKSFTLSNILPAPPITAASNNWPNLTKSLITTPFHNEGCERKFAQLIEEFVLEKGKVCGVRVVDLNWGKDQFGRDTFFKIKGTERILPADIVILSMGFIHPQIEGMLEQLDVALDYRRNVLASFEYNFQTSVPKVFSAGDMRRGQSEVYYAFAEGKQVAEAVNKFLQTFN